MSNREIIARVNIFLNFPSPLLSAFLYFLLQEFKLYVVIFGRGNLEVKYGVLLGL